MPTAFRRRGAPDWSTLVAFQFQFSLAQLCLTDDTMCAADRLLARASQLPSMMLATPEELNERSLRWDKADRFISLLAERFPDRYGKRSREYRSIERILHEYYNDIGGMNLCNVYGAVRSLLSDDDELIREFKSFMPACPCELCTGPSATPSDQAISYVNKVKQRFAADERVYNAFLEILIKYRKGQKTNANVYEEVTLLFRSHADLLSEFTYFLSDYSPPAAACELSAGPSFRPPVSDCSCERCTGGGISRTPVDLEAAARAAEEASKELLDQLEREEEAKASKSQSAARRKAKKKERARATRAARMESASEQPSASEQASTSASEQASTSASEQASTSSSDIADQVAQLALSTPTLVREAYNPMLYASRRKMQTQVLAPALPPAPELPQLEEMTAIEPHECAICLDNPPSTICIPCGHTDLCSSCARDCKAAGHAECPICCTEVEGWYLMHESVTLMMK